MQRMTVPADHNQTTRRYKRSTSEAFLCNATEAQAFHYFPKKKRPGLWLAIALLVIFGIALAGCAPARSHVPRVIPDGVCPPGYVGVWLDEQVMHCLKAQEA